MLSSLCPSPCQSPCEILEGGRGDENIDGLEIEKVKYKMVSDPFIDGWKRDRDGRTVPVTYLEIWLISEITCTLHINVEDADLAAVQNSVHCHFRGPIEIVMDVSVLEELAGLHVGEELLPGDKEVVLAIHFTRPWLSSGV